MQSSPYAQVNTIEEALAALGVTDETLSQAEKEALDEKGYLFLPGFIEQSWLERLRETFERLVEEEGAQAGGEFEQEEGATRLADVVNKGAVFDGCYTHPKLLAAAYYIMKRDFKIMSLNGRDANLGSGHQALHADWGKRELNEPYHIVNSVWVLDPMTKDNGATRLVPGTHRLAGKPADYVADPSADHPGQVLLEAPAGSVVIFNAHTWHGGTQNTNGQHRRVLHVAFTAREYPQQLDQQKFIRQDTYDRISPAARYILDVKL